MGFNNGFEHVRLENKWKKLRIQYREAGMSEEAIQEMYNFDQAPCQGRGRGCSFHGIPRSHQPGGSGLQL